MRSYFLKRALDLGGSVVGLVLLAPVTVVIAALIPLSLGFPILFRQVRSGLRGKPFTIYKFRTMREARDENGNPLADEARLTRLGRILRSTSLDELPELLNVFKGDMSLVGPRPLLTEYLDRYTPEQARRHEVKPGITGWAQVKGRNAINWDDRFKLDVWYVDHWSLRLDLKTLALTLISVLKREGISAADNVTMPPFQGKREKSYG